MNGAWVLHLFSVFSVIAARRPGNLKDLADIPLAGLQSLLLPLQHATLMNLTNGLLDGGGVSPVCREDMMRLMADVRARRQSAIQMIDAFGKIPSGLLRGHLQWLGAYDQCVGIPNGTANYCLTRLGSADDLETVRTSPALGICLPRTCGKNDIEEIINALIAIVMKVIPFPIPELASLKARQTVCDFDQPWESGAYVTLVIFALFIVICTFGTIVECCPIVVRYVRRRSTLSSSVTVLPDEDDPLLEAEIQTETTGTPETPETPGTTGTTGTVEEASVTVRIFESFSFATSWRYLTADRPDELPYLDGMRMATIWWVLIGKEFELGEFVYENALDYMDGMKTFLGQLIANSNLAGDTFFILSGLVLTYTMLKKLERNQGKISWTWIYLRRFLRLTPMYVMVMLSYLYLVPHIASGPFPLLVGQDVGGNPLDSCKKYWWTNLLYINNFVPTDTRQQCMDWTWFLAVEMQLFLVTPIIVLLLHKFPKVGLGTIIALIAGCLVANAVIEAEWGLPIAMFQVPLKNTTTYDPNFDYVDHKPYTRASPYLLGMILGFLFVKKPIWKLPYPKLDLVFNLGCWISSCIVANRVIFGLYDAAYLSETSVDMIGRVSWRMLSRFGFSVAVCWVILACQYDYAGPIRDILAWKVWKPLSHLTYIVYLVHPLTLQLWLVTQRDPFYYNPINMANIFFAQLVCVYGLSFVLAILVEFPLLRLERGVLYK